MGTAIFMVVFGYRVWPLLKRTWQEVMEDNILGLSAQTAYYFFFSLFPIFLFVAPLLSLIGDKEKVFGLLMTQLGSAVPGEAVALVRGVVNDVVFAENAPGLISVGALLAAWAGSNVFSALIDAMNRAYDIEERRPWWKKKLVALASVLVTGITVGLATTILLSGEQIVNAVGNAIGLGPTAKALWTFLQIPLALTMLVTIAALSFYFLPNLRPQSKKHVFAGALVTTALWVLVTLGFRFYVLNFSNYNKTYGAVGGVIVLLTWMYLSMLVFLIGGELSSELQRGTGSVVPPSGTLYSGRIETSQSAKRTSDDRVDRLNPLPS